MALLRQKCSYPCSFGCEITGNRSVSLLVLFRNLKLLCLGIEKLSGMHISGMGGIETWKDALEFMLLGAGSVQVTTAVMQYGYRIIEDLTGGLQYYLAEKGISNVRIAEDW